MSALLILFLCLALGILCRRYAPLPEGIVPGINWWVLNIALPALVLALVPHVRIDTRLWFPVVGMYVTFFGAWALFASLGKVFDWSPRRVGCLALVCGLGNTSFMGYPLVEALHGKEGLSIAVIADQLGCFPMLAAGGIVVASLYSGRGAGASAIVRRLLTFPAFIAMLAGVAIGFAGGMPPALEKPLLQIGQTLTPLALFSVGLQFRLHLRREQVGALAAGLGWKLLLAPLAVFGMGIAAGVGGLTLTVGVLQAAMAPMISAAILADQYDLEPRLANTVLGAGILLSLVTIPLGNMLLPAA
ncbi:AEC family transporter [Luteibacter yeojuensis]|uniref:AEC family transporter n=1 Tax=Luteibacter yeojuensis TaxID=345309 RepID=A0A7X5TNR1_9GAMM|nr:AEC family transporter [Luteibacter yeojuensis]NID13954.1 AEC family transporter [Luteibacter yeojuensis]